MPKPGAHNPAPPGCAPPSPLTVRTTSNSPPPLDSLSHISSISRLFTTQLPDASGTTFHPSSILQPRLLPLFALFAFFCGYSSFAGPPDKSGVKPSTISLPSGAGSIEGLGESFEPQLNTGSSSYGVGISLPPGRAGLQPKVHLAYNSSLGNSFVGLGWSLDIPCLKRQTDKGFPTYTSGDVFLFSGEELVPLSNPDGDWRCENESAFQRFRQIDTDGDFIPDAWEMTDRDGTRHIFGQYRGASNRWSVVTHPNPPSAAQTAFDRTYCWCLDTTSDLHGNRIEYEYVPPDTDSDSSGILYPSRIRYSLLNGNYHEVRFRYEDRPDKFEDYRPTFPITTGKRLAGIEVHSFYDGADHLVRACNLEYAYHPEDGITVPAGSLDLGVSTLKRVVQLDRTGNTNNYLPPLLFEYSTMDLSAAQLQSITLPGLDIGEAGGNVQIADVDGDGLPDIIKTVDSVAGEQVVCLNQGEFSASPGDPKQLRFAPAQVVVASSSNFRLSDPNSTLTDIDGHGLTDFVRIDPGDVTGKQIYVFHNNSRLDGRGSLGFSTTPQILFSAPADISFNSPAVRQMDVNFDKQSDFVSIHPDLVSSFFYYYRDRDSGAWNQLGPVFFNPDMTGYDLTFDSNGQSNPHVHLADMNGDRLLDLVYLDVSGSGIGATLTVRYWPYAGLGRWGAMHVMTLSASDNFQIDGLDLRDVLVQDFTGDGLADIAIMRSDGGGGSSLELRVNIAGSGWSVPQPRGSLPRYLPHDPSSPTTFRQADLNGNGSTDLIWRNQGFGDDSFQWLELQPQAKPNLLIRIDNSLGKRTEITYGSSTDDMVRARQAGYPWQTWCPFPNQVVRRIRTTCGLDLDGLADSTTNPQLSTTDNCVSEFLYRDAYYDSFEREFRGFAFAQRIDYGDDFLLTNTAPSLPLPLGGGEGWGEGFTRSPGWDSSKTPTGQVSGPTLVTRFHYLTGAPDGIDNDEYPPGWTGPFLVDEVTPKGGHEEEVLKGHQVWEEKVDPWVLHDATGAAGFDRGCWLALNSTNTADRAQMTPNDFVYSRARQDWTIRRLYRPNDPALAPPGRFASASPPVRVLDGLGGSGRSVSFAFASAVTNEIIEANGVLHAALSYPLRNPIVTAQTTDYDDYGNETLQRDFGVVSDASYDDERFTATDYALQGEALDRWIISKPSRIRVTDENGVFVSETRNYYDGSSFLGLSLGSLGARALLHRAEQVVADATALPPLTAQSDRPGDPRLPGGTTVQKLRASYDAYGNTIVTLDPLGIAASPSSGHARQIAYDPGFQTYPVTETILLGGASNLVISAAYDLGLGVIITSTDFNQNLTTYEYDSFGRLVAIIKPYDSSALPTALFQYSPGDPNRSRVYDYDRAGSLTVGSSGSFRASNRVITRAREAAGAAGTFVTVSYTDGYGRKLAEVSEGDTAGRWIVSKATSYNRRMAAQSEWLPYEISSGSSDASPPHFGELWPAGRPPATSLNGDPIVKSDQRHDPTGREIITLNPPETIAAVGDESARSRSLTQFLPLEKRLFDENDNDPGSPYHDTPMVQFSDGLGRLIRVHEVVRLNDDGTSGGTINEWPTQYRYDLNDNLTQITDSQGNQKWFRYDGLKRKLFMNDPDRGTMTYTYDDASNLRETVDAKAQHIQYTYDGVNRLLAETYLDGLPLPPWRQPSTLNPQPSTNSVAYHYDTPVGAVPLGDNTTSTANNTKGFLAWVEDLSGEEHTSYDARGRAEYATKRLLDPVFLSTINSNSLSTPLVSYTTRFSYDSLDRVTTLTYPDDDQVRYAYNSRSLLRQIIGGPNGTVISNILYRPSAQLQQINYGNAVQTTYAYDPRLRLSSLLTFHVSRVTEPLINFSYDFDGVSNIKAILDNRPTSVVAAGDPRRNTQIFGYDDLYRITYAGYALGAPASTTVDGGSINYLYDRIGNMRLQTSTITDTDPLTGLPVANLGSMSSGGSGGSSNRIGRAASDPPGPHALTSISHLPSPISSRLYPYDANGNMTQIDGLTNTWDFKDRLISVENTNMRAIYIYDYTDRRISKIVFNKTNGIAPASPTLTTIYIDKYFEVRDHDAPTKYVWNGNTRVAHVTGSLNSSQRVQRVRLWPGYNLISVAVNGATLPANPGLIAYLWNPGTLNWSNVLVGTTLAANSVLWVQAATSGVLTFTGNYSDPTNSPVATGPNFLPVPGLEALKLSTISNSLSTNQWRYDAQNQLWQIALAVPLKTFNSLPTTLAPGEVLFVRADAATQLMPTDSTLRVRYYHEDHLGSSSVLSDTTGSLVTETATYAFGFHRKEFAPRNLHEHYQFTQKETDDESGLDYFETRFLTSGLGRLLRVDPLATGFPTDWLKQPQKWNSYSYALNRPLVCIDPKGTDVGNPDSTRNGGTGGYGSSESPLHDTTLNITLGITLNLPVAPPGEGVELSTPSITFMRDNSSGNWGVKLCSPGVGGELGGGVSVGEVTVANESTKPGWSRTIETEYGGSGGFGVGATAKRVISSELSLNPGSGSESKSVQAGVFLGAQMSAGVQTKACISYMSGSTGQEAASQTTDNACLNPFAKNIPQNATPDIFAK